MAMVADQTGKIPSPAEHDALLGAFIAACTKKKLLIRPESLESRDSCDGLFDPPALSRFLAARGFDLGGALAQFEEAHRFREEKDIIRLYDMIKIADYEEARQLYPHWTGRRDKKGLPICFFDLDTLQQDALARYQKRRSYPQWKYSQSETEAPNPNLLQIASVFHESLIRFILPLCSLMTDRADPSAPVTSSTYIVDASSLGIKQGWSLRAFAQETSWLLSTCYPETIEKIFVCNAPSYFMTIWKFLKGWVDPHTAEKLVILLQPEVLPTLREYIEDANIPVQFGGGLSFTHGQLPDLDSNIRHRLGLTDLSEPLPRGPIKWIEELDGRKTALAVGSEAGSERSDIISTVDTIG